MMKRDISAQELPTTSLTLSHQPRSNGRTASARSGSFSASARMVCVLLAGLCVVFLFAEVNETNNISLDSREKPPAIVPSPPVAATPADVVDKEKDDVHVSDGGTQGDTEPLQKLPPSLVSGLRRFNTFKEYVEATRAVEGGLSVMPLVNLDGQEVTIPSLIIVGGQRTGTSTLFSMLSQHPDIGSLQPGASPLDMQSRGYVTQDPESYPSEAEWPGDLGVSELPASVVGKLLEKMARPFTVSENRREGVHTDPLVTMSLDPGYLGSLLAPFRLKMLLPNLKIVMLARDPVERYFSELRTILCVTNEGDIDWDDIETSFAMPKASKEYLSKAVVDFSPYDKKCLGEGASAEELWACQVGMHKSHRPLYEGLYASHLQRWRRAFDESQIHVVESSTLFQEPEYVATDVAKFVQAGEGPYVFYEFAVDREASCDPRRRSHKISSAYSERKVSEPSLRKWYAEHNDVMSDMLVKDLNWNDRIKSAYHNPKI